MILDVEPLVVLTQDALIKQTRGFRSPIPKFVMVSCAGLSYGYEVTIGVTVTDRVPGLMTIRCGDVSAHTWG